MPQDGHCEEPRAPEKEGGEKFPHNPSQCSEIRPFGGLIPLEDANKITKFLRKLVNFTVMEYIIE